MRSEAFGLANYLLGVFCLVVVPILVTRWADRRDARRADAGQDS